MSQYVSADEGDGVGEVAPALHMVKVWASSRRLVLSQRDVGVNVKKIPAVREVLDLVSLHEDLELFFRFPPTGVDVD